MTAPLTTAAEPRPPMQETPPAARSRTWRWLLLAAVLVLAALAAWWLLFSGSGETPAEDAAPPVDGTAPPGDDAEGPVADPPAVIGAGLPAPAAETAREILAHVEQGDLEALAALALAGENGFTASFGDDTATTGQLVALWERIGRDEVLGTIEALVRLDGWHETEGTAADGTPVAIHVAPAFMHDPSAANRAALEQALGVDAVEASVVDGEWLGWRLGIDADGDWRFLVSGD